MTKKQVFATIVLAVFGCSSEKSKNVQRTSGLEARADCFTTVRVHDGRELPRANTSVRILKLDERDRALVEEIRTGSENHYFAWDGGPRALAIPTGFDHITVRSMNDRGEMVGSAWNADRTVNKPFRWSLDAPPVALPFEGSPVAINNVGDIAYEIADPERFNDATVYLYRGGASTLLGRGRVTGMNDAGDIVGTSSTSHAARLWKDGVETTLATSGPRMVDPLINEPGQVAGSFGGVLHAFLWTAGTLRDLGTLDSGGYSWASALNNRGDVVGTSSSPTGPIRSFFFHDGKLEEIALLFAHSLNERRQILGTMDGVLALWEDTRVTRLRPSPAAYPPSCGPTTDPACRAFGGTINDRGTIGGVTYSADDTETTAFLLVDHCAPPVDGGPNEPPPPEEPTE